MDIAFSAAPTGDTVALLVFEGEIEAAATAAFGPEAAALVASAAKSAAFEGKANEILQVFAAGPGVRERILLVGLGERGGLTGKARDETGSVLTRFALKNRVRRLSILFSSGDKRPKAETVARMAFACRLAAYRYTRLKTIDLQPAVLSSIELCAADVGEAAERYAPFESLAGAVCWTRDLVNAPGNRLRPADFARETEATLAPLGVEVERLSEAQLAGLGFEALLAVGRGSAAGSEVVVMQWRGGKADEPPVALVGKGVTFDSGGLSIKPAAHMEHMKGDMGGAAAVVGAMRAIAARQAPVNVAAVVGLVENMPGGDAFRPGDVLTSLSGQTIEVINTDAEGRLVLCDCLTYVQDRFSPSAVVDVATLTGAIVQSLGQEYGGLFANDEGLAQRLVSAGCDTGDLLWRLPLAASYDKLIDSSIADMRNLATRGEAGAATAAQFLQRFIRPDVKWAHLDIAGVAWLGQPDGAEWATGFGVRLLDRFIGSRAA